MISKQTHPQDENSFLCDEAIEHSFSANSRFNDSYRDICRKQLSSCLENFIGSYRIWSFDTSQKIIIRICDQKVVKYIDVVGAISLMIPMSFST